MADLEQNKTFPRRYMDEVYNQRKFDVLDQLFSAELLPRIKQSTVGFLSAFPDWRGTVEAIVAEGDLVMNRWSGQGTNTASLMGMPPTGKHVTLTGVTIFRIAGGKVVEEWSYADQIGMMQQLGLMPSQS